MTAKKEVILNMCNKNKIFFIGQQPIFDSDLNECVNMMDNDENVFFAMPIYSMVFTKNHSAASAYNGILVITNKHILYRGRTTAFGRKVSSGLISINNISSIRSYNWILDSELCVESIAGDDFKLGGIKKDSINRIVSDFSNALDNAKNSNKTLSQISPADEILKYKGLLDSGIITQEEFDAKKKQLLEL